MGCVKKSKKNTQKNKSPFKKWGFQLNIIVTLNECIQEFIRWIPLCHGVHLFQNSGRVDSFLLDLLSHELYEK